MHSEIQTHLLRTHTYQYPNAFVSTFSHVCRSYSSLVAPQQALQGCGHAILSSGHDEVTGLCHELVELACSVKKQRHICEASNVRRVSGGQQQLSIKLTWAVTHALQHTNSHTSRKVAKIEKQRRQWKPLPTLIKERKEYYALLWGMFSR